MTLSIRKDAAAWTGDLREHVEGLLQELEYDPDPQVAEAIAVEAERLIMATIKLVNKARAVQSD